MSKFILNYFQATTQKALLTLFACLILGSVVMAQPLQVKVVNPTTNPLIDSIVNVLAGQGVKVVPGSIKCNLKETSLAYGTFKTASNTVFGGMKKGIVLTNGQANVVQGPFQPGSIGGAIPGTDSLNTPTGPRGRALIDRIVNFGNPIKKAITDKCVITFDIIPASDTISFNYVFASSEYATFTCTNFTDAFGLFITGPGIVGDANLAGLANGATTKNIALIPCTNTSVQINTVNSGTGTTPALCKFTSPNICTGTGLITHSNYFVQNSAGGAFGSIIAYNGFTKKLTAVSKVIPCNVYTLTFAITDVSDQSFDSGVFIEAGSLRATGVTSTQSSVYSNRFPTYSVRGCNPGKFIFSRCITDTANDVKVRYVRTGLPVYGTDYTLSISNPTTGANVPYIPNASWIYDSITIPQGQVSISLNVPTIIVPNAPFNVPLVVRLLDKNTPYKIVGGNRVLQFTGDTTLLNIRRNFIYKAGPDRKICYIPSKNKPSKDSVKLLIPVGDKRYAKDKFLWTMLDTNGNQVPAVGLQCTDCREPMAFPSQTTKYVVSVQDGTTTTDSTSGCLSTDTVIVKVYKFTEGPIIVLKDGSQVPGVCIDPSKTNGGYALSCTNIITELFKRPGKTNYLWPKRGGADTLNALLPGTSFSQTVNNLFFVDGKPQRFRCIVTGDSIGCSDTIDFTVTPYKQPRLVVKSDTVCFGTNYRINPLLATDTSGGTTYTWKYSPDSSSVLSNKPYVDIVSNFLAPQTFYVLLNRGGCTWDTTITITSTEQLKTGFTIIVTPDTITNTDVTLKNTSNNSVKTYRWQLFSGNGTNRNVIWTSTTKNPTFNLPNAGNFQLELVGYEPLKNCSDTTRVGYNPYLPVMPNIITPNGDGYNDELKINALAGELKVFNRWGKEILNSSIYNGKWNGDGVPAGVYFYEFSSKTFPEKQRGWITIMK